MAKLERPSPSRRPAPLRRDSRVDGLETAAPIAAGGGIGRGARSLPAPAEAEHGGPDRARAWRSPRGVPRQPSVGTTKPVSASTASATLPTSVAITGRPASIASTIESGKALVARRQDEHIDLREPAACGSSVHGRNSTRSAMDAELSCRARRARACSGPVSDEHGGERPARPGSRRKEHVDALDRVEPRPKRPEHADLTGGKRQRATVGHAGCESSRCFARGRPAELLKPGEPRHPPTAMCAASRRDVTPLQALGQLRERRIREFARRRRLPARAPSRAASSPLLRIADRPQVSRERRVHRAQRSAGASRLKSPTLRFPRTPIAGITCVPGRSAATQAPTVASLAREPSRRWNCRARRAGLRKRDLGAARTQSTRW